MSPAKKQAAKKKAAPRKKRSTPIPPPKRADVEMDRELHLTVVVPYHGRAVHGDDLEARIRSEMKLIISADAVIKRVRPPAKKVAKKAVAKKQAYGSVAAQAPDAPGRVKKMAPKQRAKRLAVKKR